MLLPSRDTPLAGYGTRLLKLEFHPLVLPARQEEFFDDRPRAPKLRRRRASYTSELLFIVRQRTCLPVVHNQEHVDAVLQRPEVAGVRQIVGNVEGHPMQLHGASPSRQSPQHHHMSVDHAP